MTHQGRYPAEYGSGRPAWCASTRGSTRRGDHVYCGEVRDDAGDAPPLGTGRGGRQRAAPGLTTDERERLKALERETRELRRANEILRAASAFFARELDPRLPK